MAYADVGDEMKTIEYRAYKTKAILRFDDSISDAKIEKFLADVDDEVLRRVSTGHKAAFILAVIVSVILLVAIWKMGV